jgi:hypothetical protein
LQKLLHPDARKYLPHRDTICKDIRHIYEATQTDIIKLLEARAHLSPRYKRDSNISPQVQTGAFHIALDLSQSGNGHDFLGIVIFRHSQLPTLSASIE